MPTIQHIIGTATIMLFVPLAGVSAQTPSTSIEDTSWVGVVISSATNVRCGANESYYPIARANAGDLVRVLGKRQDWLKIETSGNVFKDSIGYVKYPASGDAAFSTNGTIGTASGEIGVLAKNIESDELYRSWRPIMKMYDGDTIYVIDSTITNPGTLHRESYVVHTVQLSPSGVGWINSSRIKRATSEQAAMFNGWSMETEEVATSESYEPSITEDDSGSIDVAATEEPDPISIAELEAAWSAIASEAVMGAEVVTLRDLYAELFENNKSDLVIARIASGRIKQLDVWAALQKQRVQIEKLREDLAAKTENMSDYRLMMSMYGDYAIVGRLSLSNTFNGRLRPFMYRIQEQKSGRTLGYLPTNDNWDLSSLIGQTIGVTGTKSWDPNWRVNIVKAERFDILPPNATAFQPSIQ